jgi:hypothetical protein
VSVRERFREKKKLWQSVAAPPKIKTGPDLFLFCGNVVARGVTSLLLPCNSWPNPAPKHVTLSHVVLKPDERCILARESATPCDHRVKYKVIFFFWLSRIAPCDHRVNIL